MKLILIVPDGLPDQRYGILQDRSPVGAAYTPGMDTVARDGRLGLVQTMWDGLPLGSLTAFLGFLGIDPRDYPDLGRAALEALDLGIELGPRDVVFRCNIVSANDTLVDFTAGQISDRAARVYLASLANKGDLHHANSYRNVWVWRDCPFGLGGLPSFPPHENMGRQISGMLGTMPPLLQSWVLSSYKRGLMLWLWGASAAASLPPVPYRLCVISAMGFLCGLAKAVGGTAITPPGTTGYINTDLKAKFSALEQALLNHDVVIVHCNAPDEEAHVGNLPGKVAAITDIDRDIVVPALSLLGKHDRLMVCPDHYTYTSSKIHGGETVAYAIMGHGIVADSNQAYSEQAEGPSIPAWELLERWRSD